MWRQFIVLKACKVWRSVHVPQLFALYNSLHLPCSFKHCVIDVPNVLCIMIILNKISFLIDGLYGIFVLCLRNYYRRITVVVVITYLHLLLIYVHGSWRTDALFWQNVWSISGALSTIRLYVTTKPCDPQLQLYSKKERKTLGIFVQGII